MKDIETIDALLQGLGSTISNNLGAILGKNFLDTYDTQVHANSYELRLDRIINPSRRHRTLNIFFSPLISKYFTTPMQNVNCIILLVKLVGRGGGANSGNI